MFLKYLLILIGTIQKYSLILCIKTTFLVSFYSFSRDFIEMKKVFLSRESKIFFSLFFYKFQVGNVHSLGNLYIAIQIGALLCQSQVPKVKLINCNWFI
jgi:hypothetical protein